MFLKETETEYGIGEKLRLAKTGGRTHPPPIRRRNWRTPLIVGIIILIVVAGYVYLNITPNTSNQIVLDWRLTLTFHDATTGLNYTPPMNIGVRGGLWSNHTLDQYGPPGYAPISVRDQTGTVFIQMNQAFILRFGDLFNIWGVPFDVKCVPNPTAGFSQPYCTNPAETVVYDSNNDSSYESPEPVLTGVQPADNSILSFDPKIKFVNSTSNLAETWGSGKTIIYDKDNSNSYNGGDIVIYTSGAAPAQGAPLKTDPKLRFTDTLTPNGHWDQAVPPPVMSDGSNERCISRALGLSNGKSWIILLGSTIASTLPGGCLTG